MSASQPVPQATEPEKSSRAGRNLPAAIGVGLLLGALIIITHFWHKELFLVLATASVSIGCWEIAQAMRRRGIRVPVFPVVLGCVVQLSAAFFLGEEALFVAFALTCALVLMWRGQRERGRRGSRRGRGHLHRGIPGPAGGVRHAAARGTRRRVAQFHVPVRHSGQ
jgi:hypothetical protein